MTERRETDRASAPAGTSQNDGERIAKYLARAGIASRRACETLIGDGKVTVNGKRLTTPAFKVTGREDIRVAGKPVSAPEPTRLWRYHKPAGLITTTQDPAGRRTVFEELPKSLPRVMTVGRLDLNTEGLLLLTNDGELARALELPSNQMARTYRARAHGRVSDGALARLGQGIEVDGERFAPIAATLEQELGANNWLRVTLAEGKKREVRRALEAVGLEVNRLIRVAYGPFDLGALKPGAVTEVPESELPDLLGELMPRQRVQEHARQKTARKDARLRKQVRKRRQ